MKESVKTMCDHFIEDFDTIKKECGFLKVAHSFSVLCAFLFSANGKRPDPEQIKSSAQLLEHAVGNSLCFSDVMIRPAACCLSMSDDAETLLANSIANYQMIKKNYGLVNAKYPSLSGLIMELINRPGVQEEKAARSKDIYDRLKSRYTLEWNGVYSVLTMLLAYSEKSIEEILEEAEKISEALKPVADKTTRLLTALFLTYFDQPAAEKTEKLCALYQLLADHKPKFPHRTELLILAAITMFGDAPKTAAANILDVFDELGERNGYKGFLAIYDATTRLEHAALIVMAAYLAEGRCGHGMYVPTLTAAFLPIMHDYDRTTAVIMAGNG